MNEQRLETEMLQQQLYAKQKRKSRNWKLIVMLIVFAGLVVGGSATAGYLALHRRPNLDNPAALQATVGKLMILPDEEPVIATVVDKSQLDTPFLQKAQNGDKIIIYQKAARVIIYRPSVNKIVDVGPVTVASTPSNSSSSK